MRTRQHGITFIGWLFLLLPIAIVAYAGIRLAPVYLNYMKVSRSLDAVRDEMKSEDANATSINKALDKHFVVESVQYPALNDVSVKRDGHAWIIDATYDDQAPLFANISILVAFHKAVQIGNTGD
jgi:hypothetical protein